MSMVNSVAILDIVRRMKQLAQKFQALKTTQDEYFYLKLLILLNPDAKNLSQPSRVRSYQERVQENLFDLGMAREGISAGMKIGELLLKLSELERLSHLIKEHLVFTQVAGQLGPRNYSNLENMLEDD
ncbi:hepatocyte nuclear factor 4-alpha-like [Lytechinus variegatus]|uniref:hepatocyte nuclear factor 4-alpha-like n=1 Tax=Lytechinus variegatus TaxID=7654 RepID=UPI001BB20180|nr:hepatocyte nuclear factor 4-alpha-like [Lytechinus variegatus]